AAVSLLAVGRQGCLDFVDRLLGFAGSASGTGLQLRDWKYVDLNTFLRLLVGGPGLLPRVLWVLLAAGPVGGLAVAWWQTGRDSGDRSWLLWAATVAGTLVFNV